MKTPAEFGYRMPAEWEKQEAVILNWPHYRLDWPGKFPPILWIYVEFIRHITHCQRVRLVVQSASHKQRAMEYLERSKVDVTKVDFYIIKTNRGWMRDSGPIYVTNKDGKAITNWRFNGWAKYKNHKFDDALPEEINKKQKLPIFTPMHNGRRVVLEGGSIDVNGKGLLLTTEECLQSKIQERNPGFSKDDYLEVFSKYLGVKEIIWLGNGIEGDDTHGHVDDITRFVNANTVITAVEPNKKEHNHKVLDANLKVLRKTNLNIIELPMPKPVYFDNIRLPASYANFLIINDFVLVPTFSCATDRIALNIIAEAFKGREVVGIHAYDLIVGLGTLHCLSQQEPA
jgi:agmatine deiminase